MDSSWGGGGVGVVILLVRVYRKGDQGTLARRQETRSRREVCHPWGKARCYHGLEAAKSEDVPQKLALES